MRSQPTSHSGHRLSISSSATLLSMSSYGGGAVTTRPASKTAAQMALSRAIEAHEPPGARICDDPFAEQFLDRRERLLIAARPLRRAIVALIERRFAGHHHYLLVAASAESHGIDLSRG
jgi:hypothetical protein